MPRFRDLIKNSKFSSRFSLISDDSKSSWLRTLGKNDFYHSQNIEMLLDRLVPSHIKQDQDVFDHGEIFILLAAVYLHDIGRKSSDTDHEIYSYKEIVTNPDKYHLPNNFVAEAVGQVCAAHSPEEVWPIEKCDSNYGIAGMSTSGRTFNLQKLGALLRLADELDNSFLRVNEIPGQENSPRQIIRDVNPIHEKGIIEIQAEPSTWEQWSQLHSIRNYCQKRLSEIEEYLEKIGLNYYQIWLQPGEFYEPLSQESDLVIYYDLVEAVALLAENHYSKVDILEKINGSEISVLCTDKRLGCSIRTAILVRDCLTEKATHECAGVLTHLKKSKQIDHGTIVTREYPDSKCTKILSNHGINAISISGLVDELYEFHKPLSSFIKEYRALSLYKKGVYISLSATLEDGEKISDAEKYITDWVNSPEGVQLTVLGDFGAGKTTITEHITYNLAKKYLAKENDTRIPIHIKLKNFGTTNSIESIITDYFVNNLGVELSYRAFCALNKAGKFLIMLDGFDEIPNIANEYLVLKAFRQLDKLVEINSKVIITCRTHFFKNMSEVHELHSSGSVLYNAIDKKHGYNFLFLSPLEETQIEEYLNKWDKENSANYVELIRSIYNLSDLATRPALLNIIAKTVPQLHAMNMTSVNAASLYNIYIRFWLQRDDWRSHLDIEERLDLANSFTEYMFVSSLESIHYESIPKLNFQLIRNKKKFNADIYDYELRTCNFLRRDHEGNYSFVHKSFMEFLLAKQIFSQLTSLDNDIKLRWVLPIESQNISNTLIASKETEDFFLQLMETWLPETSGEMLKDCSTGRRRDRLLLINICERLCWQDYVGFYVELLLDPTSKVKQGILISLVLQNENWKSDFGIIKDRIQSGHHLNHYDSIITSLAAHASEDQVKKIEKLSSILTDKLVDEESENDIYDSVTREEDYPFSRKVAKEDLLKKLNGLEDEIDIQKAKKDWRRQWLRQKSEYDKERKKQMRQDKKDYEHQFKNTLKARERDGKR